MTMGAWRGWGLRGGCNGGGLEGSNSGGLEGRCNGGG